MHFVAVCVAEVPTVSEAFLVKCYIGPVDTVGEDFNLRYRIMATEMEQIDDYAN